MLCSKGMFGASGALSVSVGITFTYCLGALLHWYSLSSVFFHHWHQYYHQQSKYLSSFGRLVCAACGLLPILVFLAMLGLPETPPWLVLQVRDDRRLKN